MAKIIETIERDCCTWFILDDGNHIEAEYGYSIGNEVGIHSHTGSRTELRLVEGHSVDPDSPCIEKTGFDCAADYYHQTEYFGVTPELAVKTLFEDFGLHQIKRESK